MSEQSTEFATEPVPPEHRVLWYRVAVDSMPMTLAHFCGMQNRQDGANPQALSGKAQIDYFATESDHEERLLVFAAAVDMLDADFGSWNTPWGEVNRYQRPTGE